jgi:hypothetical protein
MIAGLVHRCTIQKRYQKKQLAYTGLSGTVSVGQTIIGGTSHATATVDTVTSYLKLTQQTGTFSAGETATTTTGSLTVVNQYNYLDDSGGVQYYWKDDQTNVPCRFYVSGGGSMALREMGQLLDMPNKVMFPADTTIDAVDYRIVSTVTGFTGTFHATTPMIRYGPTEIVDHIEYVLQVVPSP